MAGESRKRKWRRIKMWALVDHACKHCSGRLLRHVQRDGKEIHRCSECGAQEEGPHHALCWCGVDVPGVGLAFECHRNTEVMSTGVAQEVLIRERLAPTEKL